jgi:hypothetical protein
MQKMAVIQANSWSNHRRSDAQTEMMISMPWMLTSIRYNEHSRHSTHYVSIEKFKYINFSEIIQRVFMSCRLHFLKKKKTRW